MSRTRVGISLDSALLADLDEWRGDEDRSAVIERALRLLIGQRTEDPRETLRAALRTASRAEKRL